eukprot:CAMPEP_0172921510 /NCGR_PEP_ID=MMETSP1075-20121228/206033_1 /TAXON_ID=2916 /ORGANISM="Ceratium fusus, Strain PA161109" /LENGTH=335 /DNA_ID=CAMNT_0013781681 /DNA_START=60 /DNA_END=1064 /DNA_ORIENTATION=+
MTAVGNNDSIGRANVRKVTRSKTTAFPTMTAVGDNDRKRRHSRGECTMNEQEREANAAWMQFLNAASSSTGSDEMFDVWSLQQAFFEESEVQAKCRLPQLQVPLGDADVDQLSESPQLSFPEEGEAQAELSQSQVSFDHADVDELSPSPHVEILMQENFTTSTSDIHEPADATLWVGPEVHSPPKVENKAVDFGDCSLAQSYSIEDNTTASIVPVEWSQPAAHAESGRYDVAESADRAWKRERSIGSPRIELHETVASSCAAVPHESESDDSAAQSLQDCVISPRATPDIFDLGNCSLAKADIAPCVEECIPKTSPSSGAFEGIINMGCGLVTNG